MVGWARAYGPKRDLRGVVGGTLGAAPAAPAPEAGWESGVTTAAGGVSAGNAWRQLKHPGLPTTGEGHAAPLDSLQNPAVHRLIEPYTAIFSCDVDDGATRSSARENA